MAMVNMTLRSGNLSCRLQQSGFELTTLMAITIRIQVQSEPLSIMISFLMLSNCSHESDSLISRPPLQESKSSY